jgi:hypothetical protein
MPLFNAATNFVNVFNMSATKARQKGRVQLEQSDMCLAMNMAKMAKEGLSLATIEEMKYMIKTPRIDAQEQKKGEVVFRGHTTVKDAIERHLAILCHNQVSSCHPCQSRTAMNPQTRCRQTGIDPCPPYRGRQPAAVAMPPLQGTRPAVTGNTSEAQPFSNFNVPAVFT